MVRTQFGSQIYDFHILGQAKIGTSLKAGSPTPRPAIGFCYLRPCLNGWPTYQNMHHCIGWTGSDECKFGCNAGNDSLKHYCACQIVKEAYLKLNPYLPWRSGVQHFLCLHGTYTDKQLLFQFRFIYSVFMTFNYCRHNADHRCDIPTLVTDFLSKASGKSN